MCRTFGAEHVCVCVCVFVCVSLCVRSCTCLSLFCCLTHPNAGALARAAMTESVFMSNGNDRGPNTTVSRRTQRRALTRARFHPGATPSSCVRFLIFLPLRLYAPRLRLAPRAWLTRPFCIVQGEELSEGGALTPVARLIFETKNRGVCGIPHTHEQLSVWDS